MSGASKEYICIPRRKVIRTPFLDETHLFVQNEESKMISAQLALHHLHEDYLLAQLRATETIPYCRGVKINYHTLGHICIQDMCVTTWHHILMTSNDLIRQPTAMSRLKLFSSNEFLDQEIVVQCYLSRSPFQIFSCAILLVSVFLNYVYLAWLCWHLHQSGKSTSNVPRVSS